MATTPLSQAIMAGMDPEVFRSLQNLQTGQSLTEAGLDASPTTKWGAAGRLAQALAGSYLTNTSTSDLAKTQAAGRKNVSENLLAGIPGLGSNSKRCTCIGNPAVFVWDRRLALTQNITVPSPPSRKRAGNMICSVP